MNLIGLQAASPGRQSVAVVLEATHDAKLEGGVLQVGAIPSGILLQETRKEASAVGGSRNERLGHDGSALGIGCFHMAAEEFTHRAIIGVISAPGCARHCASFGFLYSAMRTPSHCACGNNFGAHGAAVRGQCTMFCADTALLCGAKSVEEGVANVFESTLPLVANRQAFIGCYQVQKSSLRPHPIPNSNPNPNPDPNPNPNPTPHSQ